MTNTEKPITKQETKKQGVVDTIKQKTDLAKVSAEPKAEDKKVEQLSTKKISEQKDEVKEKPEEEKKKPIQKKPVVKKTEAVVNAKSLPISTKYSMAICRFIKNKKIGNAIVDLEQVIVKKKAVPMKGEIPHKKGKGMMSGRYPKKASEHFVKLLKSLLANANANEIDTPIIVEAVANLAQRPYGRFGRTRKKRTHVKLIAREKKKLNEKKGKK